MAKISAPSSQPFDRVFAVSIVKCTPTIKVLAAGCQGLKITDIQSSRTDRFSVWASRFSFSLDG